MKVGFSPADVLDMSEAEASAFLNAYVDINTPKGRGNGLDTVTHHGRGRRLNKNRKQ